jgi:hypothetical protein
MVASMMYLIAITAPLKDRFLQSYQVLPTGSRFPTTVKQQGFTQQYRPKRNETTTQLEHITRSEHESSVGHECDS